MSSQVVRRSFRGRVASAALSLALVCSAALSSPAGALPHFKLPHLKLLRSSPAADTTLTASPDAIRLWLSEPADAPASKITLAKGTAAIPLGAVTRDAAKDAPLVAKVNTPLTPGAYTVTWKAMSKDGHVVNGTFTFTLRAAK